MGVIIQNNSANWTLLNLVNRVRNECGVESVPSDAATYDFRSTLVTNKINDACMYIWRAARWPWTRQRTTLVWVAGQSEYNHPDRHMRVAVGPIITTGSAPLPEIPVDEWPLMVGHPDPYPEGTPSRFTVYSNFMKVYPAPSADFVATYPNAQIEWFKEQPPRVTDDNDGIEVPEAFVPIIVAYAKHGLLLHLGDTAYKEELGLYNQLMAQELAQYHVNRRVNRMIPDDYTVSLWG
jgi:hypothetical protein